MSRIHIALATTIVFACAFHRPFFGQSRATLEGIVLDTGTGQPLEGVQIGISTTGVTPIAFNPSQGRVDGVSAITNSDGRFFLQTTQVGRFRVIPTKDGYIFARKEQKQAVAEPGVWVQVAAGGSIKRPRIENGASWRGQWPCTRREW
jgi:hypothetical protein